MDAGLSSRTKIAVYLCLRMKCDVAALPFLCLSPFNLEIFFFLYDFMLDRALISVLSMFPSCLEGVNVRDGGFDGQDNRPASFGERCQNTREVFGFTRAHYDARVRKGSRPFVSAVRTMGQRTAEVLKF